MTQHFIHHVPGRIRVRTPELKQNPVAAANLCNLLDRTPGVGTVRVNALTGSVTVLYDREEIHGSDLLSSLESEGYVDSSRAVESPETISATASQAGRLATRAALGIAFDALFADSPLALLAAIV